MPSTRSAGICGDNGIVVASITTSPKRKSRKIGKASRNDVIEHEKTIDRFFSAGHNAYLQSDATARCGSWIQINSKIAKCSDRTRSLSLSALVSCKSSKLS